AAVVRLIEAVHDDGVVGRGALEMTAPTGPCSITERPGVDEKGLPSSAQRECERVGVTVRGNRQITQWAGVGDDPDLAVGLEGLTEDEIAALGKRPLHRQLQLFTGAAGQQLETLS